MMTDTHNQQPQSPLTPNSIGNTQTHQTTPTAQPQPNTTNNTPPVPPQTMHKNPLQNFIYTHKTALIISLCVVVIILIILYLVSGTDNNNNSQPAPTPTTVPTRAVTPIRQQSNFATTSAFIALDNTIASLSATISNTNLEDDRLTPPNIDISIGFSK